MRHAASIWLMLAALGFQCASSQAQDYPTRPIRVITVNGPGGTADIFLRALGQEIQKRTGQPFVVEPRPGGNFTLGARGCAEAPTDGYTICMLNNEALAYNEFLYKTIPYNPARDFMPITNLLFITTALPALIPSSIASEDAGRACRTGQGPAQNPGLCGTLNASASVL